MESYHITIVSLSSGKEKPLTIMADEGESSENILLKTTLDGTDLTASHPHYFTAFQDLRDQLLHLGFGMKCSGARENAVASPMMALVPKVYLVTPGQKALMKDVVHTFGCAEITDFPDTARQERFFQTWGQSLTAKE